MAFDPSCSLDPRTLRCFVAVAEERNVSRAALRLSVSQPPLTRQIRALEDLVGTPLFTRHSRGVELTDAGRAFLEDARRVLELMSRSVARARGIGGGRIGRLDVAVLGSGVLGGLPRVLARFRETHPGVDVVVHTMNKPEQLLALREGRISIGFSRIATSEPDIDFVVVESETLVVALPEAHPLSRRRRVGFAALAPHPLVVFASGERPNFIDIVERLYGRHGRRPIVTQIVEDAVTAVALAAAGFGVCLVPGSVSCVRPPGVVFRPLSAQHQGLIDLNGCFRRDDRSPVLHAFLSTLSAGRGLRRGKASGGAAGPGPTVARGAPAG